MNYLITKTNPIIESEKMVRVDGVYMNKTDFVADYFKKLKRQFPFADNDKIKKRGSDIFDSSLSYLFK